MSRVIITGATSMVGAATMRVCLAAGDQVFAVVRPGTPRLGRIPDDSLVRVIELELDDYGRIPQAVGCECDVMYHFAWGGLTDDKEERLHLRMNDRVVLNAGNVAYVLDALGAAHELGCGKFIGAGSQAEYGAMPADIVVGASTPISPDTAYGVAKYAAGKLAMMKAADYGMDCVWVRIYSVYGPGDRASTLVSQLVPKLIAGEPVELSGGSQLWDYLYADDAGEALRLMAEVDTGSIVFRLASGESRPLREFVQAAKEVLGSESVLRFGSAPDDDRNLRVSVDDLKEATGWCPRTPFIEGVVRIAEASRACR